MSQIRGVRNRDIRHSPNRDSALADRRPGSTDAVLSYDETRNFYHAGSRAGGRRRGRLPDSRSTASRRSLEPPLGRPLPAATGGEGGGVVVASLRRREKCPQSAACLAGRKPPGDRPRRPRRPSASRSRSRLDAAPPNPSRSEREHREDADLGGVEQEPDVPQKPTEGVRVRDTLPRNRGSEVETGSQVDADRGEPVADRSPDPASVGEERAHGSPPSSRSSHADRCFSIRPFHFDTHV